ncbi:hypothetical protein M0804_000295 [Polistes exclamans]|nr:hypothetical protein M0804_000295 [Polistes exclamans]
MMSRIRINNYRKASQRNNHRRMLLQNHLKVFRSRGRIVEKSWRTCEFQADTSLASSYKICFLQSTKWWQEKHVLVIFLQQRYRSENDAETTKSVAHEYSFLASFLQAVVAMVSIEAEQPGLYF